MNATYIRIDLVRQLRDVSNLMFTLLLPVGMYLLFGANASNGDLDVGNSNVRFYIMTSMAAYGAALACTSIAAGAASESMLGWGRQIALTRGQNTWVANKVAVAMTLAGVATGVVFVVGWATDARADSWGIWLQTLAIILLGAAVYSLYGFTIAMLARSETAVGIAAGSVVFLAFLGNLFLPLEGTMLEIARWTPMYGYATLTRWPSTEGFLMDGTQESLLWAVVNFVVWTLILVALALLAARRSRGRQ